MAPLPRLTVRQKIVLVSVVALVPLIVYAYVSLQVNVSQAKEQQLQSSAATVRVVAASVDQMIEGASRVLSTLAMQPEFLEQDREHLNDLLARALPLHPAFTTILVSSNDGIVKGLAQADWAQPVHIMDRWYSRDVMAKRATPVSGRLIGYVNDEPSVAIAVPLKDDIGQRVGVLVAALSLGQFQQNLMDAAREEGARIIVVDSDGVVITHPDWRYVSQRISLMSLLPVQRVLSGHAGTAEYRDPSDGELWLASYLPVSSANWGVVVAYPANTIYVSLQEATLGGLVWLIVAILLGAGLAGFLSRQVTQPIRALSARALTMATSQGSLVQKCKGDEIEQLGSALSCLSDGLSTNMQELIRMRKEVQEQATRLQGALTVAAQAQEQERKRLAQDVHDGVAQLVAGALCEAQASERALRSNPRSGMKRLQAAEKLLAQAVSEIDQVLYDLRPADLAEEGLVSAIHKCLAVTEEVYGIRGSLEIAGTPAELPVDVERNIYRIVQEALHNSRKHSGASEVHVALDYGVDTFRVVVRDHGRGFDETEIGKGAARHLGLIGMQERAHSVGGDLVIRSALGSGTAISVEVPVGSAVPRSLRAESPQVSPV